MTIVNVSTREVAEARRDRIKAGMGELRADIKAAWRERDWLALGYESWDAMCESEYRIMLALPRDERPKFVAELRQEGMSTRAIASAVGVSHQTIKRDLDSGVTNVTPEVRGTDGKTYAPTQPVRVHVEVIDEPERSVTVNVPTIVEPERVEVVEVLTSDEWKRREGYTDPVDDIDTDAMIPADMHFKRKFWRHIKQTHELLLDMDHPEYFDPDMTQFLSDFVRTLTEKHTDFEKNRRGLRVVQGGSQ